MHIQLLLVEDNLDLANTVIKAPANGHLGEVGVRLGQFVSAGTQLMALVPEKVWVVANFKEQQIAQMRVGQPVRAVWADGRARAEVLELFPELWHLRTTL